jgi:hypothetical protein
MTEKPKIDGTVRISNENYTVITEPKRDNTDRFFIRVQSITGRKEWAWSEGWRFGCGPWKINGAEPNRPSIQEQIDALTRRVDELEKAILAVCDGEL